MRAWVMGAAVLVGCLLSPQAGAYVPFRTTAGQAFHWAQPCVPIRVYLDGLPGPTAEQTMNAVTAAAEAWSSGANSCSFLTLVVERGVGPAPIPQLDGVNTITFQATTWCHQDPASGACPPVYDPSTPAITSVYTSTSTGVIREADIELNAKNFVWGDLLATPSTTAEDLQNLLTHELGHFIGLDSSCVSPGGTAHLDDQGQPEPACNSASQAVRDTTMFPGILPGETQKRTLEPDDQNGVCGTYPRAVQTVSPPTCSSLPGSDGGATGTDAKVMGDAHDAATDASADLASSSGCGCRVDEGGSGAGAAVLVVALALASRRRRQDAAHFGGPRSGRSS